MAKTKKSRSTRAARRSKTMPPSEANFKSAPKVADEQLAQIDAAMTVADAMPVLDENEPVIKPVVTPKVVGTRGRGKSAATKEGEKLAFWLGEMAKAHAEGRPYVRSESAYGYARRQARKAFHLAAIELDQAPSMGHGA